MRQKKKRLVTRQEGITLLRLPMKSTPLQFWSFFSLKSKRKPIPDKTQWNGVGYCNYTARIDAFSRFFKSVYKDNKMNVGPCADLVRHHSAAKLRYLQKRTAYSKQWWRALCQKVSETYEEDDRNNLARQIAELTECPQNNVKKQWRDLG